MFTFPQRKRIIQPMYTLLRLFIVTTAYAQDLGAPPGACDTFFGFDANGNSGGFGKPGLGFLCIREYSAQIMYVIIGFTASISLIILMISGFRYMIGPVLPGGSSDAAKKGITGALIGITVSLLAYAIVDTIVYYLTK